MAKVMQANRLKSATIEMRTSSNAKAPKNLAIVPLISKPIEIQAESRPKNLKANILSTDGYELEVDGRVKAQYDSRTVRCHYD